MYYIIHLSKKEIFYVSILIAFIAAFLINYIWTAIAVIIVLTLFFYSNSKYIYPFFIIVLLVITSDISETLRIIVNIGCFVILGFLFIKKYGIDFNKYPKLPTLLLGYIGFLFLSLIISSLFSSNPTISFIETFRQLLFFVLIYFLFSALKTNDKLSNYFIWSLIIASTVIAVSIVYYFLIRSNDYLKLITTGLVHEGGYINNVAAAGGIFVVGITLTLVLILKKNKIQNKYSILLFISLFIQIVGLLLTNSRAAVLGFIISFFFVVTKLNKRLIWKIFVLFIIFLLSLLIIFPNLFDLVFVFFRGGRVLSNTRYLLWPIAFDIFKDNPIVGIGPGMFKFYMYKYIPVMIGSWDELQIRWLYEYADLGHVHNFILFLTSELGIMGFISSISLPFIFFHYIIKTLKKYKNNIEIYPILIGIIGLGVGLFARSLFESTGLISYGWITRDLPFWVAFIILIDLYQKGQTKIMLTNNLLK